MKEKPQSVKTHLAINAVLKEYLGEGYIKPSRKRFDSSNCQEMPYEQIHQGVIAFVKASNLPGGSGNDVDLYKLMNVYITDLEAREKINAVVNA